MINGITGGANRDLFDSIRGIDQEIRLRQRRITTGKREQSTFDDTAVLFRASEFTRKAADLNRVLEIADTSQAVLKAAQGGLGAIKNLLNSAKSIAQQALATSNANYTFASVLGSKSGLVASAAHGAGNNKTLTFSDGTTTATVTTVGGQTFQNVVDALNNTAGLQIRASLSGDGRFMLEATGSNSIILGGTASGGDWDKFGLNAGTYAPPANSNPVNQARKALAAQFDAIRGQIDDAAKAAGLNGINLLKSGTLSLKFSPAGDSSMTVNGFDAGATSIGFTGSANQFQSDADVNAAINQAKAATDLIEAQSFVMTSNSEMADARKSFVKTLASLYSQSADQAAGVDVEEESATLMSLQARRELALGTFSLLGDGNRSAMQLLGIR